MIGNMRTFRPPSRQALRRASREPGKPAAALAIITTIFAVAIVIKLLPPSAREALLPITLSDLPARALTIWTASHTPVAPEMMTPPARTEIREPEIVVTTSVGQAPVETATPELPLTFDRDPGVAPLLQSTTFMPVALATEVTPESAEIETTGNSPLVMPFAKTGSALRFAFVKTGSAIKAAASGTAGVFVSNP